MLLQVKNISLSQDKIRLEILDSAICLEDLMNLPSNRFEALSGDREGQYSISINMQWRILLRMD